MINPWKYDPADRRKMALYKFWNAVKTATGVPVLQGWLYNRRKKHALELANNFEAAGWHRAARVLREDYGEQGR